MSLGSAEDVISRYQTLAYGIARQYRNKGIDWDDLKQESLIGLLKAYQNYDPDKEAQFSTYASYWIKKQVLSAFKQAGNHETLNDRDLSHQASKEIQKDEPEPKLPESMPELEKKIITLSFVQQLSLKEISKQLNISVERVNQTRKKALRRLKLSFAHHPRSDA